MKFLHGIGNFAGGAAQGYAQGRRLNMGDEEMALRRDAFNLRKKDSDSIQSMLAEMRAAFAEQHKKTAGASAFAEPTTNQQFMSNRNMSVLDNPPAMLGQMRNKPTFTIPFEL